MADDSTFTDEIGQAFTHLVGVEAHLFEALGALDGVRDHTATLGELEYLRKVLAAGRESLARTKTHFLRESTVSLESQNGRADQPEGKSVM